MIHTLDGDTSAFLAACEAAGGERLRSVGGGVSFVDPLWTSAQRAHSGHKRGPAAVPPFGRAVAVSLPTGDASAPGAPWLRRDNGGARLSSAVKVMPWRRADGACSGAASASGVVMVVATSRCRH